MIQTLLQVLHKCDFDLCQKYIHKVIQSSRIKDVGQVHDPESAKYVLIDFSLTVKAATLIFISGRGSAISSPKEGKLFFSF